MNVLRVVHPSQAEAAEREYILARLRHDWPDFAGNLLAAHTVVTSISGRNLLVLCDHNTFANELTMLAMTIEKKIEARYRTTIKIHARASRRIDWQKAKGGLKTDDNVSPQTTAGQPAVNPVLDELIARLEATTKSHLP